MRERRPAFRRGTQGGDEHRDFFRRGPSRSSLTSIPIWIHVRPSIARNRGDERDSDIANGVIMEDRRGSRALLHILPMTQLAFPGERGTDRSAAGDGDRDGDTDRGMEMRRTAPPVSLGDGRPRCISGNRQIAAHPASVSGWRAGRWGGSVPASGEKIPRGISAFSGSRSRPNEVRGERRRGPDPALRPRCAGRCRGGEPCRGAAVFPPCASRAAPARSPR